MGVTHFSEKQIKKPDREDAPAGLRLAEVGCKPSGVHTLWV
jgi:hypothetical protein